MNTYDGGSCCDQPAINPMAENPQEKMMSMRIFGAGRVPKQGATGRFSARAAGKSPRVSAQNVAFC
jgi:hypothetical protein